MNHSYEKRAKQEKQFPCHNHVYHLPLCGIQQSIGKGKKIFDFPVDKEANRHRSGNSYGKPLSFRLAL